MSGAFGTGCTAFSQSVSPLHPTALFDKVTSRRLFAARRLAPSWTVTKLRLWLVRLPLKVLGLDTSSVWSTEPILAGAKVTYSAYSALVDCAAISVLDGTGVETFQAKTTPSAFLSALLLQKRTRGRTLPCSFCQGAFARKFHQDWC